MKNPVFIKKPRREDELVMQGWTKRFFASGSRLQETKELYESMGLEVHLKPAQMEDLACPQCEVQEPLQTLEGCYVIYTRPKLHCTDERPDWERS